MSENTVYIASKTSATNGRNLVYHTDKTCYKLQHAENIFEKEKSTLPNRDPCSFCENKITRMDPDRSYYDAAKNTNVSVFEDQ